MDVVVLGEPLVEFSADHALTEAATFHLSFSGDALNAAVAAAAQGARVALVTRVGADEFGERLVRFAAGRSVEVRWMARGEGSTGAYAVGADPSGERAFVYLRHGSAASRMGREDVDRSPVAAARVVLLSGVTAAISATCAEAVRHAAMTASGRVVYDPNFRSRLTTPEAARAVLRDVAPHAALVKISCPGDSLPLLGCTDPGEVVRACRALGAGAVAVTLGGDGVLLAEGDREPVHLPAFPAERIVDQTGAGDVLAGTVCAFLARREPAAAAVRAGMAAAAVSLSGRGGTGRSATPHEIDALLRQAGAGPLTGSPRG
ncbi:PfkB family carbohydrate kinase [Streptosporangium fragile]|uniref:PfkB family carbohydrate kinase n=1 Tax=Streptosporangium fragile TaxID=46186 RepID=A0ABN3WBM7_9ACTN